MKPVALDELIKFWALVDEDRALVAGRGARPRWGFRLEHLRGSALGFRNLTNYVARSLLETGGFRSQLHPRS
jgi:hypothetical protein